MSKGSPEIFNKWNLFRQNNPDESFWYRKILYLSLFLPGGRGYLAILSG
jgi:hypothetical protein